MTKKNSSTAFPNFAYTDGEGECFEVGLTKREYFAAIALQGILANPSSVDMTDSEPAEMAVTQADELILQEIHNHSEAVFEALAQHEGSVESLCDRMYETAIAEDRLMQLIVESL